MLWEFQRDGLLPYERNTIPDAQRTPVEQDMLSDMEPSLAGPVPVSLDVVVETAEVDDSGWEQMPTPVDEDDSEAKESAPTSAPVTASETEHSDERAQLEAELARLDASWDRRKEPAVEQTTDPALAALEARLSNLDF